jgi:hypothetical protein
MKKIVLIVAIVICAFTVNNKTKTEDIAMSSKDKIVICHIPPGNHQNPRTIEISVKALEAHLAHGDFIGSCYRGEPDNDDDDPIIVIW